MCRHSDEIVELGQLGTQEWHSPIAFESFKEHSQTTNHPVHIEARCTDCATEAKDRDDTHQAHRLEAQAGVTACPDKWLAIPTRREDKDAGDTFRVSAGIHSVDSAHGLTFARTSDSEENEYALATTSSSATSCPKFSRQRNLFHMADLMGKISDSHLYDRVVDTNCQQTANNPAPFAGESAFIEHLIAEYASLFDSALDSGVADRRYERPRAVPTVPKRASLDSVKQRGSTSTTAITKSNPVSRNFRRLRLKIQHSAIQPDQESPDWACQTSRAIEAAYKHRRDSAPRHILDALRSPSDRRRVQSYGPGGKEGIYLAPPSKHSWTHPAASRHSEDALQLVRRANAAGLVGKLEGMEVAVGRESLRHGCMQVASPIDLNKSLPALPLQVCGQDGREQTRPW
jgi:hypothetical protein